jgi:hypothetical protein
MASAQTLTDRPELAIAAVIGISGTAKLAGAPFTKANFARWGYADWWRPAIGAVEVATALAALASRQNGLARRAAAVGTLSTMGGAIATHTMADEPTYNAIPALVLAALAAATLI